MPECPFALWRQINGSVGDYISGPFKIVHHTTEGSSAEGAMSAYSKNRSDPHFTVDATYIYQHIDTGECARSLRNKPPGNPETNRDSAVQIEIVGFAHLPKGLPTLTNLARLLRWIEGVHGILRVWPNGYPKPATFDGHDPGGHNRDPDSWDQGSGHFGHCHVPKNTHWDPAYTEDEVNFLMQAIFTDSGKLKNADELGALTSRLDVLTPMSFEGAVSTMPDHDVVEE